MRLIMGYSWHFWSFGNDDSLFDILKAKNFVLAVLSYCMKPIFNSLNAVVLKT